MNKEQLEKAQTLHREGRFDEALKCYQQLLEQNPNQAELLHAIGILYAQTGKYDQSLKTINKAIKNNSKIAAFYNSKGNVLLRLDKLKEASTAYQNAIKLKSNYAAAYNNLANSYYRQDKLTAAKKAYETAIELKPNYADAHYNFGILLAKFGENKQAIKALEKTLSLSPSFAPAFGQLGEIYLQQNNYGKAIEFLKKRLDIQPKNIGSQHNLGLALLEENQIDAAIKAFEKVLMLEPRHEECNHHLATAYIHAGDYNKALNYYFRQIEINPLTESYYNIGVLLMNQERHREAIQYLNQAAEMEPNYLPVHLNLGALYLKMQRRQDAIKHYQQATKIQPDNPEIQHIIAALSQDETAATPEKAPTEYLQHLFDQYATYYDKHLTQYLHYKVPEQLFKAIFEETGIDQPEWNILDLGCGTGLSGEKFKSIAKQLIGIDISEKMIATAQQKNIYDELKVDDIQQAIDQYHDIDLILAADVFTYIGNLEEIFSKAKNTLTKEGLFAFTVEKTNTEPYELQQSIRYAHSKKYLNTLIENNNFKILRFDNIVLRTQQKKNIEGYLILLKK